MILLISIKKYNMIEREAGREKRVMMENNNNLGKTKPNLHRKRSICLGMHEEHGRRLGFVGVVLWA